MDASQLTYDGENNSRWVSLIAILGYVGLCVLMIAAHA
jgi:hypothetical protein